MHSPLRDNDEHHEWAVEIASRLSGPALTCEAVLAEASFHVRNARAVLDLVDDGMLDVAFELARHVDDLGALEADFRVYRRNKRDVIPCVVPPRRR